MNKHELKKSISERLIYSEQLFKKYRDRLEKLCELINADRELFWLEEKKEKIKKLNISIDEKDYKNLLSDGMFRSWYSKRWSDDGEIFNIASNLIDQIRILQVKIEKQNISENEIDYINEKTEDILKELIKKINKQERKI